MSLVLVIEDQRKAGRSMDNEYQVYLPGDIAPTYQNAHENQPNEIQCMIPSKVDVYYAGDYCDLITRRVISNDEVQVESFDIVPHVGFFFNAKITALIDILYAPVESWRD